MITGNIKSIKNVLKLTVLSLCVLSSLAISPKVLAKEEVAAEVFSVSEIDSGHVAITAYTGGNERVDIPTTIDNKIVSAVSSLGDNSRVKAVTIPSTVKTIGDLVFSGCRNLETVSMNNSGVEALPDSFLSGTKVTDFEVPASVREISYFAFAGDEYLKTITVASSSTRFTSEGGCLYDFKKTRLLHYPVARQSAYYKTPSSLTSIEENAVTGNKNLEHLYVEKNVTTIGNCAFKDCTNLKDVTLYEGVSSIGSEAFSGCNALSVFNAPVSLTSVATAAVNSNNPYRVVYAGNLQQWWTISAGFANATVTTSDNTDGTLTLKESDVKIGKFKKKLHFSEYETDNQQNDLVIKYNGDKLILNTDYTVTYSQLNKPGKVKMTVNFCGKYKGSFSKTYTTYIKKIDIKKVGVNGASIIVKNTLNKKATGYQYIIKPANKETKADKIVETAFNTTKSRNFFTEADGTYKVCVRAYVTNGDKTYYSKKSTVWKAVVDTKNVFFW